ncbi:MULTISPECIES: UV DNA damage repair endonuclease UvsE [unclassified Paenibacillus]|uniref:UV DNA damage repair endonuclease UvsE n=1 Tax=unclassified Paenibacillus TaxID=185978 RepID=UPI0024053005|nr:MULTISPECIES: UV DNA damage repair endonuclease UvsE [unclassified Paenibacillus]MDF9844705.1 UV DNA damage endonuclease [Paenibacillus sp. PastF-2]MDF9851307.1 UV DNA damage endonuclease [Paenibacillus sp. PastM-2]MDF9857890.1 UV DNA damage endonuclease [Paenibacillus sp. PastF-1]MDH6483156.1 UV DNA damage endonuclease [Paenibacillus sp. PastH-2]MDH6510587.1 UV DNA damage endonuclease [Paenibacillus sp. PastM-3]
MIVRFGYVAMSTVIKDCSPSKTMTMASFNKLDDREAGLRRLEQIARMNLHNTLRLLKHNVGSEIKLYRLTSKLIPLSTHPDLQDWNPFTALAGEFAEVGEYIIKHGLRVSFHPDHFTVLSTPRPEVLASSVRDLQHHTDMLDALGLPATAKNNIHIGGAYGDKPAAAERFKTHFAGLPSRLQERMTLENDDKTFNAPETLAVCRQLGLPMVLDIHHQWVNNEGELPWELWPDILDTWKSRLALTDVGPGELLPPKIHVSSPRSPSDPRSHADGVEPAPLLAFLKRIAADTPAVDVMIEAKLKDGALFSLMEAMKELAEAGNGITVLSGGSINVEP